MTSRISPRTMRTGEDTIMINLDKWETWTPGTLAGESITRRKRSKFRTQGLFPKMEMVDLPTYIITKNPEGGYLLQGAGFPTPLAVGSITKARRLADLMGEEIITSERPM